MKDIKKFQQMHRDGQLSRRDFLAAMSALGVSTTAAGSFLTSTKALAATPRKGGTARFASNLHGPDDQMDPIVFTSGIDYTRGRATYNGLIQIRDNMALAPSSRRSGRSTATPPSTPSRSAREWSSTTDRRLPRMTWSGA